jgi:CDP-diacylglycerol pyrophosphatase
VSLFSTGARRVVFVAVALVLGGCALAGDAPATRDVLWRIVDRCLDPASAGYCERCGWPRPGTCGDRSCAATTEVWVATAEFVALRDLKMCGCPAGFVHGIALPRARVTGVEDPKRPAGIWSFAWSAARARIVDETEIALVVNPPERRGQDQLHVHLVRLQPGAAARLAALHPEHVDRLDAVWDAAERHARAMGTTVRGIVVTRASRGCFAVVTAGGSPERDFSVARCG